VAQTPPEKAPLPVAHTLSVWGLCLGFGSMFLWELGIVPLAAIVLSAIALGAQPRPRDVGWKAGVGLAFGIVYLVLFAVQLLD